MRIHLALFSFSLTLIWPPVGDHDHHGICPVLDEAIMKNRGRSPAAAAAAAGSTARTKDTLRSGGTGSSGRSVASDLEHEDYPSGVTGALAATTSTLAAATAEETVTIALDEVMQFAQPTVVTEYY